MTTLAWRDISDIGNTETEQLVIKSANQDNNQQQNQSMNQVNLTIQAIMVIFSLLQSTILSTSKMTKVLGISTAGVLVRDYRKIIMEHDQ